ncbi:MAG: acetate/propionate family kinase, partial [Coriobacteriales bacterium]|nr:acetate/propionate family kinase [Coriobacteriales bacterium]
CDLAPLHNPAALQCILKCMDLMPYITHVAVFDTAFHQSLQPHAFMYPLPYEFYTRFGIRKYGAHGTSHRYIAMRTAQMLGEDLSDIKIISCHLGNGCSLTAIDHGISVDTTMGFTPLGGVMMGTRSGDLDPAVITFLMEQEGYTPAEINELLNRESGIFGVSGLSNDMRDLNEAIDRGDENAILAHDMYIYSIKKQLAAYAAVIGGVDAISFSGGIGENAVRVRRMILSGLEPLGIILDQKANEVQGKESIISSENSRVKILVVPTKEELMIALDTEKLASGLDL